MDIAYLFLCTVFFLLTGALIYAFEKLRSSP